MPIVSIKGYCLQISLHVFSQDLLESEKGLPVICVGAVWTSFDLMKDGLIEGSSTQPGPRKTSRSLKSFTLLKLRTTLAVGAAYLGAREAKFDMPRDYSQNADAFFQHVYDN
jgi:N-acetylglucosamine kinase